MAAPAPQSWPNNSKRFPRRKIEYKGVAFEEMDLDGILARQPQIVLIDELAHTNIEGSKHRKRYEDVLDVLAANIDVLATMNVQHIESVAPTVQSVTGIQIRETVPDWLMQRADEIVMADLTPEALQTRMRRGDIYGVDRAEKALANFFRRGNLIALRELALQHVTKAVDRTLTAYMDAKRIEANWAVRERVAVCISSNSSSQMLIARGARVAEGVGGELFVLHVDTGEDLSEEEKRPSRQICSLRATSTPRSSPSKAKASLIPRPNLFAKSASRMSSSAAPPSTASANTCTTGRFNTF